MKVRVQLLLIWSNYHYSTYDKYHQWWGRF